MLLHYYVVLEKREEMHATAEISGVGRSHVHSQNPKHEPSHRGQQLQWSYPKDPRRRNSPNTAGLWKREVPQTFDSLSLASLHAIVMCKAYKQNTFTLKTQTLLLSGVGMQVQ